METAWQAAKHLRSLLETGKAETTLSQANIDADISVAGNPTIPALAIIYGMH